MKKWLASRLNRAAASLDPVGTPEERIESSGIIGPATKVLLLLLAALVLPLSAIAVYAACDPPASANAASVGCWTQRVAAALLLATGPVAIGALIGFLFGIPKSAAPAPSVVSADGKTISPATKSEATRLEELSDWGTKLMVGAGLTQLGWVAGAFEWSTLRLQLALGQERPGSVAVAWTTLAYFLTWGFFGGFLITRLWLLQEFRRLDEITELKREVRRKDEEKDKVQDANQKMQKAVEEGIGSGARSRSAVESVVLSALYQPPPEGFRKAIEWAKQYVAAHPDEPDSVELYVYLACAHGQAYAYEQSRTGQSEILRQHREEALQAARKAIALRPAEAKPRLRSFLVARPGAIDDDLVVFRSDPEFQTLLV